LEEKATMRDFAPESNGTRVADGIAVITVGSARRIYFDAEMADALHRDAAGAGIGSNETFS
jgi:hypothetical protein